MLEYQRCPRDAGAARCQLSGACVARQTFTLIGNEGPLSFNNLGWMTDNTSETAGNNVIAGVGRDGTNGIDATVPGASCVFNFAYDPETQDPLTAAYQNGEMTDIFYWSNRYLSPDARSRKSTMSEVKRSAWLVLKMFWA
jgi:hypothetical protein